MSVRPPPPSSTSSYNNGHPSRHETQQSVSSTSSRSERDRERARAGKHPAVETAVTRLLVSIKQLLEALTKWSNQEATEGQVSDVYVRLGNDFNGAVSAFASYNIDMSELMGVPDDLRAVLEDCLSEDATTQNLDKYLPKVRAIITALLTGLRGKQSVFREIVSGHKHRSESSGHSRTDSGRLSRAERVASTSSSSRRDTTRSHASSVTSNGGEVVSSSSRRSAHTHTSSTSTRRKEFSPTSTNGDDAFIGGFSPRLGQSQPGPAPDPNRVTSPPPPPPPASVPASTAPERPTSTRQSSAPYVNGNDPENTPLPTTPRTAQVQVPASVKRYSLVDRPVPSTATAPAVVVDEGTPPPTASFPDRDRDAQREREEVVLSVSPEPTVTPPDRPMSTSPPPPPAFDSNNLYAASSLAALKKSDALERRASKRFSTYNISKMTGAGGPRDRSMGGGGGGGGGGGAGGGGGERHGGSNRRSLVANGSGILTPGELAVLTEMDEGEGDDEGDAAATPKKRDRERIRERDREREGGRERSTTRSRQPSPIEEDEEFVPPVPPLPRTPSPTKASLAPAPSTAAQAPIPSVPIESTSTEQRPPPASSPDGTPDQGPIKAFLQVGREVKKAMIEPGLTFGSLRMLFVDKFAYNPGQEDFPAIYIRDPSSGVQYELEDMDEVKQNSLLSLNIEPLDQIKQHIDIQISGLSQELRDLRKAVADSRPQPRPSLVQSLPDPPTPAPANRPTDRQLQTVARRLSRMNTRDDTSTPMSAMTMSISSQPLQPQMTGASIMSEYSNRVVSDLRTQFDEVQNLRRDLGIMRQLYTEFSKQTKESLGALKTQTQKVRQMATTQVSGARAYIDTGKQKLDLRSQNVLTKMEELQDTVESVKDDVLKRNVSPKSNVLRSVKDDMEAMAAELESLKEHIKTIKPMWKKTWGEELQSIVEEQQFLNHQEEFLGDLLEDHKAVVEIFGHVEKVISLKGQAAAKGVKLKSYRPPPPPEEGHGGLSTVMLELQNAQVDPEKRMKAIAANQRTREKELAGRSDEFEEELKGFVGGKKLKMTGGAEEAERVRQKRNDMTLRAMFNGGARGDGGGGSGSGSMPSSPSGETYPDDD
ncbi:AIP3-domain-containing protein [Stereum hirsutum FP-91666 SS1]|uniref:AIP3-domain-containing protein n=1 Tax=Stereum hirsutum (strain FP-91666) TaxID=721885 RepID=UPI000440F56A|nr:AIP3-domain-containing protein [Stereum hirsutum FP-91666 SS1]EIM86409.1 AIP3-domain-containing protein [Stereum hirsutum FP-91666 SS1]